MSFKTSRHCARVRNLNPRRELHGEDGDGAVGVDIDLTLPGMTTEQLGPLFTDRGTAQVLLTAFDQLPEVKGLKLAGKLEDYEFRLYGFGEADKVHTDIGRVHKFSIESANGMFSLNYQIQVKDVKDDVLMHLKHALADGELDIELCGPLQKDLPEPEGNNNTEFADGMAEDWPGAT